MKGIHGEMFVRRSERTEENCSAEDRNEQGLATANLITISKYRLNGFMTETQSWMQMVARW